MGVVRRLTRLPPRAKSQVVAGQLIPLLTYGVKLHQNPPESVGRLLGELQDGLWEHG